jgi:sugar phosphate isomerase/epimerase
MKRRNFIKTTSVAAVASLVLPKISLASQWNKMVGIQLYTIRDLVNKDFEGTLKMLSGIGYRTVEAAGYSEGKFYGLSPEKYQDVVRGYGLLPISSHAGVSLENAQQTIDDHLRSGAKYLVVPYLPEEKRQTIDDYKKIADEFNQIGDLCTKAGLTFGYHNHAFEFEEIEGEIPYNILLENTEPDLVTMQLDTYWMVYGGYDPLEYFNNFPGRFKLWHVKDMDNSEKKESTEVGSGILPFKEYFKLKNKAGLEYYFLEQEEFKMDMEKSITQSFSYLNSLEH